MARPQEKPAALATPYSPITEREKEGLDDYDEEPAAGGCLRRFCFGWDEEGSSHNHLLEGRVGAHEDSWLVAKLKKLKELSERVAGPKWKNFIRRIGRLLNPTKRSRQKTAAAGAQFQYSPESYALNFAGDEDDDEEEGTWLHSFSSRFAPRDLLINDQRTRAEAAAGL